jgi:apolipoprotein N-acyltransferase
VVLNSPSSKGSHLALGVVGGAIFAYSSYDGFSPTAPFLALIALSIFVWLAAFAAGPSRSLYLFGISFYTTAFYWIPDTLKLFSGFPTFLCYGLFVIFVLAAALQFLVVGFVQSFLKKRTTELELWGLLLPLSWIGVNQLFPRMFPWEFVHPFISWSSLSGLAEFVGVEVLTFLLLWFVNLVVLIVSHRSPGRVRKLRLFAGVIILLPLIGGTIRTDTLRQYLDKVEPIKVAIIQPNFEPFAFMDRSELPKHTERLLELSEEATNKGAQLLIWPESSINRAIPEQIKTFDATSMQYLGMVRAPYVAGGLIVRQDSATDAGRKAFNAGLVIGEKGEILGRYYKRILMPFGEYMPGASLFPFLKEISPQTGDFSGGDIEQPVTLKIADRELKIGLLICYEDIVSTLSRDYLLRGANLLVNLTNDVWYGDSFALSQHNLLAAWRAIEVRTYLVRGTNTGLSSVIDPIGRMIVSGKNNTEQTLFAEVRPGRYSEAMFGSIALALECCITICFWGAIIWGYFASRMLRRPAERT